MTNFALPGWAANGRRFIGIALMILVTSNSLAAQSGSTGRWYRGNTHAHTNNSDGDADPDVVARWYRTHGYQFVVITDHEYLTEVGPLNALLGAGGWARPFLVIPGQEVTQWMSDKLHRAAHVNSINGKRVVYPMGTGSGLGRTAAPGVSIGETYRQNLAAIAAAGGVAQVNHPNYMWSVQVTDLYDLPDSTLYELQNGLGLNELGGVDDSGRVALSTEAIWDTLLTRGKVIWAVGSDDSHESYDQPSPGPGGPGQAWVMVRADTLTADAIAAALRRGNFYGSTGVTLTEIVATQSSVSLVIGGNGRYRTRFIGAGGKVLSEVTGSRPGYRIRGDERYVRAVVTDANGKRAWTQPVFIRR